MQCHAPMTLILTMILADREQKTMCFLILGLKRLGVFRFNQKTMCFEVLGLKLNVERNSDPSSTHAPLPRPLLGTSLETRKSKLKLIG